MGCYRFTRWQVYPHDWRLVFFNFNFNFNFNLKMGRWQPITRSTSWFEVEIEVKSVNYFLDLDKLIIKEWSFLIVPIYNPYCGNVVVELKFLGQLTDLVVIVYR